MSLSADGLFVPLSKRPEATTVTVRNLLGEVTRGRIRLPDFQRPLRWTNAEVLKLFDSLWRGYPVGSLLFWKRNAEADERVPVGSAHVSAPAMPDAWFVVDGQQRITALAASLLDLPQGRDRRWSVWFDPTHAAFVSGPPDAEQAGTWVPGPALGDLRRLSAWLRDARVSDLQWQRIEEAQQRILDYAFPVYVVQTDDVQALRGVFARTNSTGSPMRADEVFQALLGSDDGDHGSLDLDALQEHCDLDGFGMPPRSDVLKAVLSISGLDPSRRLQDLAAPDLGRLVSRDAAEEALQRTVTFLMGDCGIPSFRLLPYPLVFSLLARWFHLFPETAEPMRTTLARWVWRGAATGAHQRAAVGRMRDQVTSMRASEPEDSLRRLLGHTEAPLPRTWKLEPFNGKNARTRIETLALLAREPRTPEHRISTRALLSQDRLAKEVFASSQWDALEDADRRLARSAANRVLLDEGHTGVESELRTWGPDSPALESHLIDPDAWQALRSRDIPAFLRWRGQAVSAWVQRFVDSRTGAGMPTLLPASAYLDEG